MARLGTPITHPLFLALTLGLGANADPTIVINEFAAINDSGLKDEDGDHSDWLELHNYGEQPVDLSGTHLTDNRKKPIRWEVPTATIEPGEYLVIFLSGKDRGDAKAPLHANFALKGKGGYLGLLASDGLTVIHEYAPAYPKQKRDISYGLSATWQKTPGMPQVGQDLHYRSAIRQTVSNLFQLREVSFQPKQDRTKLTHSVQQLRKQD